MLLPLGKFYISDKILFLLSFLPLWMSHINFLWSVDPVKLLFDEQILLG